MSEADGSWKFLYRSKTHCKYMDEDDSKKEIFYYTVPPEAEGKRIFFKAKVDYTGLIRESNEDNNWSDIEV
jgi:hypothetical protein